MPESLHERVHYRPDQGVKPALLPVLIGIPAVSALGVAWLLNVAYVNGWYWIILLPCLLAFVLGGMMHLAVKLSHCRQPWVAGLLGLTVGVSAYLGHFYFAMVDLMPNAGLETLPDYIRFRMATDIDEEIGRPNQGVPRKPNQFMNWWAFVTELLFLAGCPFEMGRRRARRAYTVDLGRWMERDEVKFSSGAYGELADALTDGQLQRFVETHQPITAPQQAGVCTVSIEYVKAPETSPLDHDVYLTAVEKPFRTWVAGVIGLRDPLDQVLLESRECLTLQPLFPALAGQLRSQHEELRGLPETTPGVGLSEELATDEDFEVAHVEEIPEEARAYLFSGKHLIIQNFCGGLPLVGMALGIGLGVLGYFLSDQGLPAPVSTVLYALAGIVGLASLGVMIANPYAAEQIYTYHVMKRTVLGREERLFDPEEPGVIHVALTARENWQKVKLESATDAGLALFDERSRELLYEGDVERIRIPGGSVIDCRPEQLHHPLDKHTQYWFSRIVVRIPEGTRELLMVRGATKFDLQNDTKRRQSAIDICERIAALNPQTDSPSHPA